MMIKKSACISCLVLLCSLRISYGQNTDLGGWANAGFGFDIIGDLSGEISEEVRYNFSIAELYQTNTDIALGYKFNKHLKVSADYRYSIRPTKRVNRTGIAVSYKQGVQDFDFTFKTRFLYAFTPDAQEGSAWRNKLTAAYKINKQFSPFVSGELFYSLSNQIDQLDNYRLEAGLNYDLNKHNEFSFGYLYDHEFNVNNPTTMHIFTIGYFYSL